MNEKESEKYSEKVESWMSLSGDAKDECIYRYPVEIRIQADIARQLTRIADQGELRMALTDAPAPDALVDRLAGLLRQAQGKLTHRDMPLYTELESALTDYRADHKKAVT